MSTPAPRPAHRATTTSARHRRAKIVATLGPASDDAKVLARLVAAGLDVARINFSHGDHAAHARTLATLRDVAAAAGRPVGVLADLQGPKIRVGRLAPRRLEAGDHVVLTVEPGDDAARIRVSYPAFCADVAAGDTVLLDDGRLQLQVERVAPPDVHCRVLAGGTLTERKGLNLPGAVLSVPPLSAKDLADLDFAVAHGVDWIAMSFVQRAADIVRLRDEIAARGARTPIVAKIEKPQAVAALDEILDVTDAVMVARGDLGVELPAEEVPGAQKRIIAACNHRGVPVITATQMLESMVTSPTPTRAEASDVANAILDGTDAVMLSAETASGSHPVQAVETMARIVTIAERDAPRRLDLQRRTDQARYDTALAIGYAACHAADMTGARAITCLTQSGSSARTLARYRPSAPIIALTASPATCRMLALVWGVLPLAALDFGDNADATVGQIVRLLRDGGHVAAGDRVIVTTGQPFAARRATNTLRIEEV
jgi:pyruvate kinase